MFYGLNGPPEIDAVLMSSDSRKKKGRNVSVVSVCTFVCLGIGVSGCTCQLCPWPLVCAIQMGEGFTHANEVT